MAAAGAREGVAHAVTVALDARLAAGAGGVGARAGLLLAKLALEGALADALALAALVDALAPRGAGVLAAGDTAVVSLPVGRASACAVRCARSVWALAVGGDLWE